MVIWCLDGKNDLYLPAGKDEMELAKAVKVVFDDQYQGLRNSILGMVVSL